MISLIKKELFVLEKDWHSSWFESKIYYQPWFDLKRTHFSLFIFLIDIYIQILLFYQFLMILLFQISMKRELSILFQLWNQKYISMLLIFLKSFSLWTINSISENWSILFQLRLSKSVPLREWRFCHSFLEQFFFSLFWYSLDHFIKSIWLFC
jgi:hypothetical protein